MSVIHSCVQGGEGVDIGENIANSLMLDSSLSQYLSRTPAAGNRKTWTYRTCVKRGVLTTADDRMLISARSDDNNRSIFYFNDSVGVGIIRVISLVASAISANLITNAVYRDPSAFYDLLIAVDTPQVVASDRVKIYVNGVQVASFSTSVYPAQNADFFINANVAHDIGRNEYSAPAGYFDGYLAAVHFIDGQALTPSSFGRISPNTGQWVPKNYTGTYGTNGFKLDFTNGTALGTDSSGNGNNWTLNGGITSANQYTDTPTNNYAVLNPLDKSGVGVLNRGGLSFSNGGSYSDSSIRATIPVKAASYFEHTIANTTGANNAFGVGIALAEKAITSCVGVGGVAGVYAFYVSNVSWLSPGSGATVGAGAPVTSGTVISVACDVPNGKVWIGRNNVWFDSSFGTTGNPSTGTNPTFTVPSDSYHPFISHYATGGGINFGARPFTYTPPAGFKALCTANLPTPPIIAGANHFRALLDTGANIMSNLAALFPYYLDWIKDRANTNNHQLIDTVRGSSAVLQSNTTAAEITYSTPSGSSVGWAWNMGGAAVANNAGSITSQVSANVLAGQSIVTYTGTGANATVGHGLGVAPKMVIVKARGTPNGSARSWFVYTEAVGATKTLYLDLTASAATTSGPWNNTAPTSSLFSLGTEPSVNWAANNFVAYCFSEVEGYSKVGSYVGNGSADGPFVDCGFKPAYVLLKRTDAVGNWVQYDTARTPQNSIRNVLYPNLSNAEDASSAYLDLTSNGFKLRSADVNVSGGTYIFYAIAEAPQKYSTGR